jgi:sulfur-carrier protein
MIKILYFARLVEALGLDSEQVDPPSEVRDVGSLVAWLRGRGGSWQRELTDAGALRVSVNKAIVTLSAPVKDGDEVAFFPMRR